MHAGCAVCTQSAISRLLPSVHMRGVSRLSSRTDCRTLRAKPHATDKRWCLGSLHSSSTKCMTKDTDKRHAGGPWLVLDCGSAGVDPRQRRRCDLALLATTNGARAHSCSITGQRLHKPSSERSDGAQSSRSNDGSSHRPPTTDHSHPQPVQHQATWFETHLRRLWRHSLAVHSTTAVPEPQQPPETHTGRHVEPRPALPRLPASQTRPRSPFLRLFCPASQQEATLVGTAAVTAQQHLAAFDNIHSQRLPRPVGQSVGRSVGRSVSPPGSQSASPTHPRSDAWHPRPNCTGGHFRRTRCSHTGKQPLLRYQTCWLA
ncbi:hypothetical protein BC831DRAFT_146265 [Entophlyctis helioformis]|nr:hypothetical protein BC831DRAFT_146265 [Entophlyctis helioformis]